MDSKGGNPFLMDDYPAEPTSAAASNPFLQDFGDPAADAAPADVNPFFSFGAADQSYQPAAEQMYQPPGDSTNPFASFGVEAAAVPEPETNVFSSPETAAVPPAMPNIFDEPLVDTAVDPVPQMISPPQQATPPVQPSPVTSPPNKPTRPPPPRPGPPPAPPRNTKDLILSVTGTMDETSIQMLDRLQATRTPSPTLMHSPSPTPEHSFADFLDVDGSVPDLVHDASDSTPAVPDAPQADQDILGLFDAPPPSQQQQPVAEATDAFSADAFSADSFGADAFGAEAIDEVVAPEQAQENSGAPLPTSTPSDNPFSDAGIPPAVEVVQPQYETPLVQTNKRPSLASTGSPVAEMRQPPAVPARGTSKPSSPPSAQEQQPRPPPPPKPEPPQQLQQQVSPPQPEPVAAASLFGDVSANGAPSGFFAQSASTTPIAPTSSAFADLLGDFGGVAAHDVPPTSPAAGMEYPSSAFGTNEMDGGFGAPAQQVRDTGDAFDAFASKFDKAAEPDAGTGDPFFDPFTGGGAPGQTAMDTSSDVWGDSSAAPVAEPVTGFEADGFDSFLSMTAPPPEVTPRRRDSADSDDGPDFSVFIKPKDGDHSAHIEGGPVPVLAPPPKSPLTTAYADTSPRFNPFDKSGGLAQDAVLPQDAPLPSEMTRTDSQETPPTPLFDEDMSQPLEDFPRINYEGDYWEMQLRQPTKKKITGQRFWKKIFVKLVYQGDNPVLQLFNNKGDKDPFQELPLLACYSVSEIAAQQFDQYGKIFTVKLQYIFYKERPGVRPGQVTKAERITNKLSQFAAYAIQGDYQGVKEFGSDLKKLGLPVEHAPQISQLFKIGSQTYEDMKKFSVTVEEALFRLQVHRDRALQYKMEEVQMSVVDELYVEQSYDGHVEKQIARVRLFFLGFLSGMPDVELGINDIWRQGKEVVGRHDIIPVATEEWIRLENIEFHACVQQDEYEKSRIIKFKPPDACYIELMRFRVRPPRNRELPLQLKCVMCVTGRKVEIRADILVPGFASRKLGRVPCEDVMVRIPIPECWIYLFRVEKHFRYGSVKSAHRRTGKIKGIERFLGAVDTLEPQLMEVTSGQAKYEHQHHAIVWRMPRLPKEGQGAYTTHQLVSRLTLTSYDQVPEKLAEYAYVEFTMPATQVSHTTARSVSFADYDGDVPPEKYVRNLSRHEYRVGIEHTQGEGPGAYVTATASSQLSTPKKTIPESSGESHDEATDHAASDSDSSD